MIAYLLFLLYCLTINKKYLLVKDGHEKHYFILFSLHKYNSEQPDNRFTTIGTAMIPRKIAELNEWEFKKYMQKRHGKLKKNLMYKSALKA